MQGSLHGEALACVDLAIRACSKQSLGLLGRYYYLRGKILQVLHAHTCTRHTRTLHTHTHTHTAHTHTHYRTTHAHIAYRTHTCSLNFL
jgi:hypothetical protein